MGMGMGIVIVWYQTLGHPVGGCQPVARKTDRLVWLCVFDTMVNDRQIEVDNMRSTAWKAEGMPQ
jgi:hypothetical protein